jgi:hypothetical protein
MLSLRLPQLANGQIRGRPQKLCFLPGFDRPIYFLQER